LTKIADARNFSPGNSEKNKFLRFLTKIADASINKFMVFIKWHIVLNLDHFWRAIDQGRSGDKPPTFTGDSEKNNFLRFLTKIADTGISEFK
jgi:hypothetical protein